MGEPIQRSTSANARVGERYVSRVISFEFLAPNIVEQIAGDHQPPDLKRRGPRQTARMGVRTRCDEKFLWAREIKVHRQNPKWREIPELL